MQIGEYRLRFGLRTLKTGLGVMLIIILFRLLHRGNPMIAALAVVFALRQDFETTIEFGISRVFANAVGGACALAYFFANQIYRGAEWVEIIVLPILLMLVIIINDFWNNNKGIIGATAAFLMIAFTMPMDGDYWYAINRVIDTFIGTLVAILMNVGVHPVGNEK